MNFDVRTAILGLAVGNLVFGSILILFQRGAERLQPIPFLVACKLLQGVGWLLLSGRGSIPDLWSFTVGNSCLLSGIAYECWAMYRIARRPVSRTRHVYSAAGITLVCILATALTVPGRIVVASFVAVIFYALSGQALLNRPGEKSLLRGYLGGSAWLLAVVLSVRGLWALVAPENFTLFAGNTIQLITFATFYYLMLTNDVGVLLLAKQSADRELRESETRFRLAFENANVGMCLVDTQGKLLRVNRQMSEMFGYSQAELESMTVNDIARPEYQDVSPRFIQQSKDREVDHAEFEKEYIHKQGRSVWGQVASTLVRNTEGEPLYFISHVLDITGRKQSEEALRESERKLKTLVELLPVGVSVLDADSHISYVNPAVEKILDITHASFLQGDYRQRTYLRSDGTVMPTDEFASVRAAREQRAVYNVVTGVVKEDGQVVWTNVSAVPVAFPDWRTLIVTADITARKRAEEALRESEEKFREFFNTSRDCVFITSPGGSWIDFNDSALELFGYDSRTDLAATPISQLYADAEERKTFTALVQRQGFVKEYPVKLKRKTGAEFDALITTSCLLNADGSTKRFAGTIRDITERQRAEAARRESEEKYRTVARLSSDFAYSCVQEGPAGYAVDWITDAFFALTGSSAAELAAQHGWMFVVHPDDRASATEPLNRLAPGEMDTREFRIVTQDGRIRWVVNHLECLVDPHAPGGVRLFGAVQDITERRQAAQRAFELALEREQMALLSKFIQDVSHEFRTPLTIIQTSAYLLERFTDPAKRQRKLAVIDQQIAGLTRLVDQLAELARLDSGVPFTPQPTDPNGLVAEAAAKLQTQAAANGVTLRLALAPALPSLLVDADRLRVALRELLDNAVRFTPAGGSITVQTMSDAAGVTVAVQDTGPGIPPEVRAHIFERFYRQDEAHSTPGFGLGLPIARAIVERHGGRLEVESQPGVGSVFRVKLPA